MINLRAQIKAEMDDRKISIPKMSHKLECHPGTLYDFFSARKAMTADILEKLLNILGGKLTFNNSD
jgi:hypothetical protein